LSEIGTLPAAATNFFATSRITDSGSIREVEAPLFAKLALGKPELGKPDSGKLVELKRLLKPNGALIPNLVK
jgi:hypothetical protein